MTRAGAAVRTVDHWVGGAPWSGSSGAVTPVWDPATGTEQAHVRLADAADVDIAVTAAAAAFPAWSRTSLATRTRILFRFRDLVDEHLDDLAAIVSREHGKVVGDARGEVRRGLEVIEFACGIPQLLKGAYSAEVSTGVDLFSVREPLGVCVGVTPFNFPVMVPMWMHPVAIACGNTFVLKPSERAPSASLLVAELWSAAGLPDGVFTVLHGDRGAVDALLDHPEVAAVSFVGSTPVARHLHQRASAAGKRVQALGGAKNHAVVLPDADLDFAADHLVAAAFGSAGERCMAVAVAVAVGDVADALLHRIAERARATTVGPGHDPASEVGPLITAAARDRVVGLIGAGAAEGATLAVDGRDVVVDGFEDGFFVGPTVLDGVTPAMAVYREEIFGPVLSIVRVPTLDDAVALVNANPFGNGTAIFTSSGEAARRFHRDVHVGMVGVNVPIPVPMAYHSFGGWKDSLFGDTHVHGTEGVAFYTRGKVVTTRWPRPAASSGAAFGFPTST